MNASECCQIQAIEFAISRGDNAILIANNGPAVNGAIKKARDAGLLVIALDTPLEPIDAADQTFATDNLLAGEAPGGGRMGWCIGRRCDG